MTQLAYRFELVYDFEGYELTRQQLQVLFSFWSDMNIWLQVGDSKRVKPELLYSGVNLTEVSDAVYANKKALMPGPPVEDGHLSGDVETQ